MKTLQKIAAVSAFAAVLCTGALAQDHHDDHHDDGGRPAEHHDYVRHDEWRKGYHMRQDDWNRGERIDYRTYHLRTPPRGYEWREVDGNYVLAAVATGVIASVIVAAATH